jgi:hypothetical protein
MAEAQSALIGWTVSGSEHGVLYSMPVLMHDSSLNIVFL